MSKDLGQHDPNRHLSIVIKDVIQADVWSDDLASEKRRRTRREADPFIAFTGAHMIAQAGLFFTGLRSAKYNLRTCKRQRQSDGNASSKDEALDTIQELVVVQRFSRQQSRIRSVA